VWWSIQVSGSSHYANLLSLLFSEAFDYLVRQLDLDLFVTRAGAERL
jgi:hypothetical protein